MADDLDRKLKQIADMFGVSDTSGLRNIVETIAPQASSSGPSTVSPPPEQTGPASSESPTYSSPQIQSGGLDYGILSKAGEMLNMFNNVSDSRITLLNSVQPFLGSQRQQRLGGAIQLLKVINILGSISPTFNRNAKG